jgi:hypothetical protein
LISNSTSSFPTDLWIPSSNNVKTEISDQLTLGYFQNFKDNKYEFSAEVYYKDMQNQIDYKDGANTRANDKIEGELLFGKGRAYGLELFFKKGYNLIVIDYPCKHTDIEKISRFASKYKTTVFLSVQLSRFEPQNGVLETNKKPLHASDIFVIVTRKETKKQSFLNKLMFWKKEKNLNLRVFKNRFGNEFSLDLHVDFENVKFKY